MLIHRDIRERLKLSYKVSKTLKNTTINKIFYITINKIYNYNKIKLKKEDFKAVVRGNN